MIYPRNRFQTSSTNGKTKRGILPALLVVVAPILLLTGLFFLTGGFGLWGQVSTGRDLEDLWSGADYVSVYLKSEELLEQTPMQAAPLVFGGFGHFYAGMQQIDDDLRLEHLDRAIAMLRKALLIPAPPLEAEINYVLAKAYFHRGRFYFDVSVAHMQRAIELGFISDDSHEYLALAYDGLNQFGKSVESYEEAISRNPSDLLYTGLAELYLRNEMFDEAGRYLRLAIEMSEDDYLVQRSRFNLGRAYLENGRYEDARDEFSTILELNPRSADAHFFLGRTYQLTGEPERARFEWREAIRIDPRHADAIRSLRAN